MFEVIEKDEEGVRVKVALHKDLVKKLENDQDLIRAFLEDLYEIQVAAVTMTATVYLRKECMYCLIRSSLDPLLEWVNTEGYTILTEQEDVPQFRRQVAIWVKNYVIEEVKTPCSSEISPVLH